MKSNIQQEGHQVTLTINAEESDLTPSVRSVYNRLRESVDADGFRQGKAPNDIVDRELGAERVQSEVIDAAAEKLYRQAIEENDLRPVGNPHVSVKKFAPYTELELEVTVEVMPEVKLPDYTKISKSSESAEVEDKEINDVLESLRERLSKRTEVDRAAKSGDEITIDFKGTKDGKEVPGARATDYAIILGSKQFIPGFEEELIGLKKDEQKQFSITFPEEYGEQSLAGETVDFDVTVKKVNEIEKPELNDEFAKEAGPFENLAGLQEDVRNHLQSEKDQSTQRKLENDVINEIVQNTEVDLPESMVEQEVKRVEEDVQKRMEEQGMDEETYLEQTGKSKEDHQAEIKEQAKDRVKTALVLTEVARKEGLEVTQEELDMRLQVLAGQYQDDKMQQELAKPEARREVGNQLMAEKTVQKLVEYAQANASDTDAGGKTDSSSQETGEKKEETKKYSSKSSDKKQSGGKKSDQSKDSKKDDSSK